MIGASAGGLTFTRDKTTGRTVMESFSNSPLWRASTVDLTAVVSFSTMGPMFSEVTWPASMMSSAKRS